ncbi:uncharacterized protein LOC119512057 [Choloepus didactylus]|uniref:uncharacterized protein LOC119512057 n=1 Tax=Choloepus didactylus TaxID=27675 RepID=UPI00189EDA5E|nr:uncharacterized protein LOC119512057 [Choloepus didactylus]
MDRAANLLQTKNPLQKNLRARRFVSAVAVVGGGRKGAVPPQAVPLPTRKIPRESQQEPGGIFRPQPRAAPLGTPPGPAAEACSLLSSPPSSFHRYSVSSPRVSGIFPGSGATSHPGASILGGRRGAHPGVGSGLPAAPAPRPHPRPVPGTPDPRGQAACGACCRRPDVPGEGGVRGGGSSALQHLSVSRIRGRGRDQPEREGLGGSSFSEVWAWELICKDLGQERGQCQTPRTAGSRQKRKCLFTTTHDSDPLSCFLYQDLPLLRTFDSGVVHQIQERDSSPSPGSALPSGPAGATLALPEQQCAVSTLGVTHACGMLSVHTVPCLHFCSGGAHVCPEPSIQASLFPCGITQLPSGITCTFASLKIVFPEKGKPDVGVALSINFFL